MTEETTKDNLFRPSRSKAETKAEITDNAARAAIQAEVDRRESKTARLREARLAIEEQAAAEAAAAPAKPTKRKPRSKTAKT
ncbi:hypothetical protein [Pararhizobium haloflavum]|uniref:hypothetical protein n=1 Tax=Pararhizobium haloflavum TaxID=2037914 RepID=UPI000C19B58E|nr:hypothetical protein [Pararhizobium haloflavum]